MVLERVVNLLEENRRVIQSEYERFSSEQQYVSCCKIDDADLEWNEEYRSRVCIPLVQFEFGRCLLVIVLRQSLSHIYYIDLLHDKLLRSNLYLNYFCWLKSTTRVP